MDFLTEFRTEFQVVWNEWGTLVTAVGITLAAVASVVYLLSKIGKYVQQLGFAFWRGKAWKAIFGMCRRGLTLYRMHKAKSVMRRRLEEVDVRVGIRDYEACLGDDPARSTLARLRDVAPSAPSWLNDYYVATALESLASKEEIVKAEGYSMNSWPPRPEYHVFVTPAPGKSAREETLRIETNFKCAIFQHMGSCPRPPRFQPQSYVETVSPSERRHMTTFPLKDMAPPCELCWYQEERQQQIRLLVDSITNYDLASIATPEVTGTNGELQQVVADICIDSPYPADVNLVKPVVKLAVDIRQRQVTAGASRLQYEWQQGEQEELVASLKEYIDSRPVQC